MDRLPRPLEGLLITPVDGGGQAVARYLVETGGGSFVVNHRMRCLIEALARARCVVAEAEVSTTPAERGTRPLLLAAMFLLLGGVVAVQVLRCRLT